MKNIITILLLLCTLSVCAQRTLHVKMNDGQSLIYNMENVRQLNVSDDYKNLVICMKTGDAQTKTLQNVERFYFEGSEPEFVDLGLSVKWATCNVGASSPGDSGDYYAWGETSTKSDYSWGTYVYSVDGSSDDFTKYTYYKTTQLELEDDIAHVKWGGSWRMPTYEEMNELRDKCTWVWTQYDGCYGYVVTGSTGNSIFLPAVGGRENLDLLDVGNGGYYWSSSLYYFSVSTYAFLLYFNSDKVEWTIFGRYDGFPIRPVCP